MNGEEALLLMLKAEGTVDAGTVTEKRPRIKSIEKSDVVFDDFSKKEIDIVITMDDDTIVTLHDTLSLMYDGFYNLLNRHQQIYDDTHKYGVIFEGFEVG